jgi:myo-inositol-1(or 4)-monophosphatase
MHPMLNIATRAARRAGTIISRAQQRLQDVKVDKKGHQDYVTQVDRDAEAAIIDTLLTAYPNHAIKAEESGEHGQSDFVWVIDPLDGTLNFMHGYPHFAISIALRVKGRLDQAVIYDPMRDELFTASRGTGALLNGQRIRVARTHALVDALLATGFPVRQPANLADYVPPFATLLARSSDIRRAGAASLDLAYVACGRLDGYWENGLKEWDIAAGSLIVQESGGLVGDPGGGEKHLASGDIVAANPKIYRQMIEILALHMGRLPQRQTRV